MDFEELNKRMHEHISWMVGGQERLFTTGVDINLLWETYLNSFPNGMNPVFRERREYDCQTCKSFVRQFNVVAIKDGKIVTIWDFDGGELQPVLDAMSALVKSKPIQDVFVTKHGNFGAQTTKDKHVPGLEWNHFYFKLPKRFIDQSQKSIGDITGQLRDTRNVFKRSLDEITQDALLTVMELINSDSLYRGDVWKSAMEEFLAIHKEYHSLPSDQQDNYCWHKKVGVGIGRIRNHSIGKLLTDLSEGVELTAAVKSYDNMVAPQNYKRSKPLITEGQKKKAMGRIVELGFENSLARRHATADDVSVNDVIWATDSTKASMSDIEALFSTIKTESKGKPLKFDGVQEMSVTEFIDKVLPTATKLELYFDPKLKGNLVSLVAPQNDNAKSMFSWDNPMSWTYSGNMGDSALKREVEKLGGRVDGALRFSHTWNETGQNQSLMDLHVFMPGCDWPDDKVHDRYPKGFRVGWNRRKDYTSGGNQDVDFVRPPGKSIPVENITFPKLSMMPEGEYTFLIHNWDARHPNNMGGKAELECGGSTYQWVYDRPLQNKEWLELGRVVLKNGEFTFTETLPCTTSSEGKWGLKANQFHEVEMVTLSPNHWGSKKSGQKHYMFMLEGCIADEPLSGFFNEYLSPKLREDRRVFEVLSNKMVVPPSDTQLSGLGFSSTQRESFTIRVTGNTKRVIKVNI